jgi:hypothetical protein
METAVQRFVNEHFQRNNLFPAAFDQRFIPNAVSGVTVTRERTLVEVTVQAHTGSPSLLDLLFLCVDFFGQSLYLQVESVQVGLHSDTVGLDAEFLRP